MLLKVYILTNISNIFFLNGNKVTTLVAYRGGTRTHAPGQIASNTFSQALLSPKSTLIEKCLPKQIFHACFLLAPCASLQYNTVSYFIQHCPFHSNQYVIHPSPGIFIST